MNKVPVLIVFFFFLPIAACGGSGNLPAQRPAAVVSGAAVDAPIINGNVAIYAFADGQAGALLGSGVTDNGGNYSVSIRSADQPILVAVSGGYYIDEATGQQVDLLPGQSLTTLANYQSGTPLTVMVTPFTHLAAGLAEYDIAQRGISPASAIDTANKLVSELVGVDVVQTAPLDITDPSNASPSLSPGLQYGFEIAALSNWTQSAALADNAAVGSAPYNSISLADLMHEDIAADGELDGKGLDQYGDPASLHVGTFILNEDIYRHALAVNMIRAAQNPNNKTALSAASAHNPQI